MPWFSTYATHLRVLLLLGLPLIGGHLAQFAIGLTDTAMLGWYGVAELAAVTVANGSYFIVLFLFGAGFAIAVMPLVAAAAAVGDELAVRRSTRMGLWLSVLFSALVMPLMWWSGPILRALDQPEAVADLAEQYLRIAGWGLFPALLVMVLKSYLAALGHTMAVFWVTALAAVLNAVINYALIFGHFGVPELGIRGAAIGSVLSHGISLLAVAVYAVRAMPQHELFRHFWRPDREIFAQVLALGLPIGLTTLSEISVYAASAVMMGWIGTVPLAAHGIVLGIAEAAFMVHLGFGNATTIRAGTAYGLADRDMMRNAALVATVLSQVIALVSVVLFLAVPEPLMALFVARDAPARPEIFAAGAGFLAIAAPLQFLIGAQVVAVGLLRGVQDMRVPMVIGALSYTVLGIGASYILGFMFDLGGAGIWLGLLAGVGCASLLLMRRFWRRGLDRTLIVPAPPTGRPGD